MDKDACPLHGVIPTNVHSASQSLLLKLPAELRNEIFGSLLEHGGEDFTPQLLRTCRKIHIEGCGVLWHNNVLRVEMQQRSSGEMSIVFGGGRQGGDSLQQANIGTSSNVTQVRFLAKEIFDDFDHWPRDLWRYKLIDLHLSFLPEGTVTLWARRIYHQLSIPDALTRRNWQQHVHVHTTRDDQALVALRFLATRHQVLVNMPYASFQNVLDRESRAEFMHIVHQLAADVKPCLEKTRISLEAVGLSGDDARLKSLVSQLRGA